ncbi:hypothetical protein J7M28_05630, partial [bacterium]|nr:hypothetical protein [bacterium]
PVATAEKLGLLIDDRELRRKMGRNAVKWIAENFDLEQQTRELEDFYYEVLRRTTDRVRRAQPESGSQSKECSE